MLNRWSSTRSVLGVCVTLLPLWFSDAQAEETEIVAVPSPMVQAVQIETSAGARLGKFLGKTIDAVSLKGTKLLEPRVSKARKLPDETREKLSPKWFDPQRKESPIRTARLFKIQVIPPVETIPVASSGEAGNASHASLPMIHLGEDLGN